MLNIINKSIDKIALFHQTYKIIILILYHLINKINIMINLLIRLLYFEYFDH